MDSVERGIEPGGPPEVQVQGSPPSGAGGPAGTPVTLPFSRSLGLPPATMVAPLAAPPVLGGAIPRPLPATGIGFTCPSPRCRDKLPYAKACGYIQHLNQQHHLEEAQSLRIPTRLPDIVKCRPCGHFCQNAKGLASHKKQTHRPSPGADGGQLPPADVLPPPAPDPSPSLDGPDLPE